jgi:hypothetical protein
VLVLVLVDTVVLVVGLGVVVVVVVVVVVGLVVVVVADDSVVLLGASVCVTVSVPPVGAGATDSADDGVDVALLLDVVDVELEPSSPVSETMA